MIITDEYSLKQMSIIEIEKVIAEALGKITNKEYQIEIANLDFEFKDLMLLTNMNITVKEASMNFNDE